MEPGGGGDQTCMPTFQCLFYRSLQAQRESLEAFQTFWKGEEKEEYNEEKDKNDEKKKEDDEEKKENDEKEE